MSCHSHDAPEQAVGDDSSRIIYAFPYQLGEHGFAGTGQGHSDGTAHPHAVKTAEQADRKSGPQIQVNMQSCEIMFVITVLYATRSDKNHGFFKITRFADLPAEFNKPLSPGQVTGRNVLVSLVVE